MIRRFPLGQSVLGSRGSGLAVTVATPAARRPGAPRS